MRSIIAMLFAVSLVTAASAQSVSPDPKQAPTGRYALETRHSQLLFAIVHAGLSEYYGRFDKLSGSLNFDSAEPEKSAVSIAIDTSSIDVPSQQLIGELAGKAVFDAQIFPSATFRSTSVVRTGPQTGKMTGDLTIKNITKPVTLDVTFTGGRIDPMGSSYAIGFEATATIKRTDFGITGMPWEPFVGDDVKLIIEAVFQQQKG